MIKEMYKVVSPNMKSCSVLGSLSLSYRINKKTIPSIGKIFVFPTFESAQSFLSSAVVAGEKILVGETENPRKIKLITTHEFIAKFWNLKSKKKSVRKSLDIFGAIKNSYVCDSFIPKRIVKENKMTKEMYKVVSYRMTSCRTSADNLELYYSLNKKTTPKVGGIFVFPTLNDAKKFALYGEEILFGEAENPKRIKMVTNPKFCFDFWRAKFSKKGVGNIPGIFICQSPENSYVCDSFTPRSIVF